LSFAWRGLCDRVWYGKHPAALCLAPIGYLYEIFVSLRRLAYKSGLFGVHRAAIPVIVVGNLSTGGTGKTPLVMWLALKLREFGFRPGVIARGYRGVASSWPQQVRPDSDPVVVGDEAVLIAKRTGLPVAVGPKRLECIEALKKYSNVDIVVSDDGLQHYAMARDIEIAVLDGVRRFGNGACIPAGPLREPLTRLKEVDLVATVGLAGRNEFAIRYTLRSPRFVNNPDRVVSFEDFSSKEVHAVAGIGDPERFFALLRRNGFQVTQHPFPDHHAFTPTDLEFADLKPIFMTEKDAVKCVHFHNERLWCVPLDVELPDAFEHRIKTLLKRVFHGQ